MYLRAGARYKAALALVGAVDIEKARREVWPGGLSLFSVRSTRVRPLPRMSVMRITVAPMWCGLPFGRKAEDFQRANAIESLPLGGRKLLNSHGREKSHPFRQQPE
jgi:hypothetical protein